MHTLNGDEAYSKHDMVSIVMSPLSEMGFDYVRGDREHPFSN